MKFNIPTVLASLALVGAASAAQAQSVPVADFYKRTNINVIVGSGTGGGYDAYARLLARHQTSYRKVLDSVDPATRQDYTGLTGQA